MEKHHPERVVSNMKKELRTGKVLDRLEPELAPQDDRLRLLAAGPAHARPCPPRSRWDEVEAGADGEVLSFTAPEVLDRVAELGDLFAPTATLEQELPTPRS